MLRALRSGGITQVLMAGVVFAIIAVFVLEFRAAGGEQTASLRRECATTVADYCVSVKDYYTSFGLIVPRGMQAKHIKALSLREHILQGLVERELLVAEADGLGISISDEAVDEVLARGHAHVSLPAEHILRLGYTLDLTSADTSGYSRELARQLPVTNSKTGEFDYKVYKRAVRSFARRSPKEFKELQRRELIAARMRDLVRSRVRLSEDAAFAMFRQERSKAVARVVHIDRDWFSRYAVDTSDSAAEAHAKSNTEEVDKAWEVEKAQWKQGCPLVSEIVVPVPPNTEDDDKTILQEKILRAGALLEQGEPFETVARELSEGPTAFVGGHIGCLAADDYGKGGEKLAEAVKGLERGKRSEVIESERGFHILKLHGTLEGDPKEAGRREVARRLVAQAEGDKLAKQFGEALIKAASVGTKLDDATESLVEEFAPAADRKGKRTKDEAEDEELEPAPQRDPRRPKVEITAPFTMGGNPVAGSLPLVSPAQLAFALEKPDDVHPELIPTQRGYAVLQLKEKEDVTREEFEADKTEILRQLLMVKQNDALIQYMKRLREKYEKEIEVNAGLVAESSDDDEEPPQ